ncbi:MAG: Uma2 family endonuclease [Bryobacteraceae bacterium]
MDGALRSIPARSIFWRTAPPARRTRLLERPWVLKSRLASLTKQQKQRFVHLCPDFVVELRSPSDRLPGLKAKMEEWIDNGAQLGWLIDADLRTVYVYRPGRPAEELQGIDHIVGEDPVDGFRLELDAIWEGV